MAIIPLLLCLRDTSIVTQNRNLFIPDYGSGRGKRRYCETSCHNPPIQHDERMSRTVASLYGSLRPSSKLRSPRHHHMPCD
ncbi:hypothetical protein TsFJ059_004042 [Trichoderma semiorbis]|uniref:Uncharacterized protein n=1 Tax=Trichoderma semiorbis TaxID=1491008 RepID=A0A9P8HST7_9HYPO|nr:hypothetical protein TsFJ059_004042 [Trichoderma semiorbis]